MGRGSSRENAEAPPVADAARCFQGSGTVFGAAAPEIVMPRRGSPTPTGREHDFARVENRSLPCGGGKPRPTEWVQIWKRTRNARPYIPPLRGGGSSRENAEALPAADAARRFQGSGTIFGAAAPEIVMPRRGSPTPTFRSSGTAFPAGNRTPMQRTRNARPYEVRFSVGFFAVRL